MKSISLLPLLAITVSPALSHPQNAAIDDNSNSALLDSRANLVPFACHKANTIIADQLAEISQLQSRNLPIPPDLGGYFYAVVYGRRLLGCPSIPLLSPDGSSSAATQPSKRSSEPADPDGHNPGWGDPCEVARMLKDQVMDQIDVMKDNNFPVPAYLAGWFSTTQDAERDLKCGFLGAGMENLESSSNTTNGSDS